MIQEILHKPNHDLNKPICNHQSNKSQEYDDINDNNIS